jgi:hypothetical protein
MALRIDEAVVRGEIDNTVEGRTTGRLWLTGREEPVELSLDGDCWRDVAGACLTFENPSPQPNADTQRLPAIQSGMAGDITASLKCRIATIPFEEASARQAAGDDIPYHWKNSLYLEWFAEPFGRVLIESSDFRLSISDHLWNMDEDAEEAQKLANLHAMRDFITSIIRRREADAHRNIDTEADEFEWEERLKESDRLSDAYQEVLEKYMDDPECERKEAFVMGWDGLLDALAERDEEEMGLDDGEFDDDELPPFDDDMEEESDHPLQMEAYEVALRAIDLVERDQAPESPEARLVSNLMQVSAKLAGALSGFGGGLEPETGYVLAILKRCLNWQNEAIAACQQLIDLADDADQQQALAHLRQSIFALRDGIIQLRRELKKN